MNTTATKPRVEQDSIASFRGLYVSPEMLLAKLDALIDVHFSEEKSTEFYCSRLSYLERTLNNLVKAERGKTVFMLIQERILKEAKHLLLTTAMPVKTMAFILGFEDPAYFSRFFKRLSGMSPKQYRSTRKLNNN